MKPDFFLFFMKHLMQSGYHLDIILHFHFFPLWKDPKVEPKNSLRNLHEYKSLERGSINAFLFLNILFIGNGRWKVALLSVVRM